MKRELVYMDAKSNKFWTIELSGSSHTVTYGRTGSAGQSATKSFPSEDAARKDAEKLIREKLGKGYVDKAGGAGEGAEGALPFLAFTSVVTKGEIQEHCGTFIGKRVHDYDPEKPARSDVVYRFKGDYDDNTCIPHLQHFLDTQAAPQANALIIGCWQADDSQRDSSEVVQALVAGKDRLTSLQALYVGDMTYEENEMSWIIQSDLSPLLEAFPKLEFLRVRGGSSLELKAARHASLRALSLESGGLDVSVIRQVCHAELPNLEHLELWLGTEDYGANVTVEDLEPILSGRLFPKLRYLGLRNSDKADELAAATVSSPLVQRLEILDLSLGTLGDEGGEALLKLSSPTLKKLNLHYNYLSPELVKKLKALPFPVDASRPSDMDLDEEDRFVAVGE